MTPEEEAAFTEKLTKQYILIPKDRLYHVIGGAIAIVVATFGINIGSVVTYLRTQPAQRELEKIAGISSEIDKYYKEIEKYHHDLGIGTFLTSGDANKTFLKLNGAYHIRPKGTTNNLDLHVHNNKYANGTIINLSTDLHQTWVLVPE